MKLARHPGFLILLIVVATGTGTRWQHALAADTDGPAADLLAAAERRAQGGDLAGAIEDYEQLVRLFPASRQAPEALLRVARSRRAESEPDPEPPLAVIERLVSSYPRAPQAAEGLLLEAEIRTTAARAIADLEQARNVLQKVWLLFSGRTHANLEARSAARVLDGELALRLQLEGEATISFLEVVEREPPSPSTPRAHIGLATALLRAGNWTAATESLQTAADSPWARPEIAAAARRRLTSIHRRFLRSGRPWMEARQFPLRGAEVRRPSAVAAGDTGSLLVYDDRTPELLEVDPQGEVLNRWPLRGAGRPSWSAAGDVLLPVRDALAVPSRPARYEFRAPGKSKNLESLAAAELGPFGEWYVLTARATGLLAFDADRRKGRTILPAGGSPVDLATDEQGRLYVLERKGGRVLRFASDGSPATTLFTGNWRRAEALTVDGLGYVHVLDSDAKRVDVYDPAGEKVQSLGPTLPGGIQLERPLDLAIGGDGRLYIADGRVGLVVLE